MKKTVVYKIDCNSLKGCQINQNDCGLSDRTHVLRDIHLNSNICKVQNANREIKIEVESLNCDTID